MSDACTCTMVTGQTPWEPAEWEQADDCPVHPLPVVSPDDTSLLRIEGRRQP